MPLKGPAVRSPRSQADKALYALAMKHRSRTNGQFRDSTRHFGNSDRRKWNNHWRKQHWKGSNTERKRSSFLQARFMSGFLHIGQANFSGGRGGDKASMGLFRIWKALDFSLEDSKQEPPLAFIARSIDFSKCEEQPGDEGVRFSYDEPEERLPQISCYITYTTLLKRTEVIQKNLHRSPLYGTGTIKGVRAPLLPFD